jgi:hypothetical protein
LDLEIIDCALSEPSQRNVGVERSCCQTIDIDPSEWAATGGRRAIRSALGGTDFFAQPGDIVLHPGRWLYPAFARLTAQGL